jgi:hypothetical protein
MLHQSLLSRKSSVVIDTSASSSDAARFAADFETSLGSRLLAVYRYGLRHPGIDGEDGGGRLLVVVDALSMATLRAAGPASVAARKGGLRVRMDTAHDLVRAADTHPVLTMTLMDTRELLAGNDVLVDLSVEPADMRLRVEQALRGLRHELTDEFLFAPRNEVRVERVLRRTAGRLVYLLAGLLVVKGHMQLPERAGGLGGMGAILKVSEALLSSAEGETLAALQSYARHDVTVTGEGLFTLFAATLDLLGGLIQYADTHD